MSEGIENLKRIGKSIYLRPVRSEIQAFGSSKALSGHTSKGSLPSLDT